MRIELKYKVTSLKEVGIHPVITVSTEGAPEAVEAFWDFVKAMAEKRGDVVS